MQNSSDQTGELHSKFLFSSLFKIEKKLKVIKRNLTVYLILRITIRNRRSIKNHVIKTSDILRKIVINQGNK